MGKLTPKETNLIDDIVRSANPLFFGKLAKLLELPFPDTIEEKERLLKQILKVWEERQVNWEGVKKSADAYMKKNQLGGHDV